MRRLSLLSVILLLTFLSMTLMAQDKKFLYVGVAKCKTCHNTQKIGKQYDIWSKGPHANSLKSLANEKSMEYAKKNGIEDPTKAAECLNCHATAASVDKALIDPKGKLTVEEGVSCESCHGPGSEYKSMKVMRDHEMSLANGLIVPEEKVCVTCHNEKNPFHKPFDYKAASAKIAHPIPEKK